MMTNVLIFESDLEFAQSLQTQLGHRSCDVSIVEDATVGLQQAANTPPDLILLCAELPRMNGFSVCNRLKRDPKLQDVPVIIMSANASEETFQQHRNLPKKRANDYVHKPIAFDDLLPRIEALLPLNVDDAPTANSEPANGQSLSDDLGDVILEDELELEDVDEFEGAEELIEELVEEPDATDQGGLSSRPTEASPSQAPIDASDDLLAEQAFDALVDDSQANDSVPSGSATSGPPPRRTSAPPGATTTSIPPSIPPNGIAGHSVPAASLSEAPASADHLAAAASFDGPANERIEELESELSRLRAEDERLHQELDEARARLASGAPGVKAKDVLDLREALNNKDKELLDLRDQLTRRDKEMLATKDSGLELERKNADLSEQVVELDKQMHAAQRAQQAAIADRDQANKRADDTKKRVDRLSEELAQAKTQLEAAQSEGSQLKTELENNQAALSQAGAERDEVKAKLEELEQSSSQEIQLLKDARGGLEQRIQETEAELDKSQLQATEALESLDKERATVSSVADALSNAVDKLREITQ